jgi:uncharacterized protein
LETKPEPLFIRHRRAAAACAAAVLAIIIYLTVGAYGASRSMRPRRNQELVATPAAFGLAYKDVTLPSRDTDVKIAGWWIPQPKSTRAIVMVPGRGENRTTEFYDHFLDLAAQLNSFGVAGFNILMIDLRAHGFSGSEISTWGLGEKHDVEGAVDWIKSQGFRRGEIGALGASLGATSCVYATADDSDISALVTDGAGVDEYPNIKRGWARLTGTPQFFFPAGLLMERLMYGYDFRGLRPVQKMSQIPPRPVLLIYGLKEMPAESERRPLLRAALPDAELWVVPGAAHTGAYTTEPRLYLSKVGAFFDRNLR